MPRACLLAVLAALAPLGLAACAPASQRMPASFAASAGPALPVRGAAPALDDAPAQARGERVPLADPPPLGRPARCGSTPGEQARAQCLAEADRAAPAGP